MPDPQAILEHLGVADADAIDIVTGGADATLYRVRRSGDTLALRVLGPTQQAQAAKENRYLAHATAHRIVGPAVIATATVDTHPASLLTWIEGEPLTARIFGGGDAVALARQFATWQRRIHALPLPDGVPAGLTWGAAMPADLAAALEREGSLPASVVHLDYHPMNCMARGDEVVAVLDWANAGIADPRFDVARTLAILTHAPVPDPALRPAVDTFIRVYLKTYGGDPLPPVFEWWAGETMLADLLPKRGHAALGWMTEAWLDRVRQRTAATRAATTRGG